MALMGDEQEVSINFLRSEENAEIYCSDTTWINKLNKLCEQIPDIYKKISETEYGCTYTFPKNMLTLRKSIRTVTEEQKEASRLRMIEMQKNKKQNKEG